MAVSAGRYRHRIKILKDDGTRDEYGGSNGIRTQIANPWCRVLPLADVEHNSDVRTSGQELLEFEIRYSKSLENPTSDMFLEFKSQEYDIITALNYLELNEKIRIVAKKR